MSPLPSRGATKQRWSDGVSHARRDDPAGPPPANNSYDEVPYESHPFAQTHPNRLATVATLFGLRPAAAALPRARTRLRRRRQPHPDGRRPARQRSSSASTSPPGRSTTASSWSTQLGLKNVELRHASILDVDDSLRHVRLHHLPRRLLVGAGGRAGQDPRHLREAASSPNGVAYVSYNTYPGWHMRGMIRDMMRYHAGRFDDRRSADRSRPAPCSTSSPSRCRRTDSAVQPAAQAGTRDAPPPGRPLPVPRAPRGGERPAVLPPVRRAGRGARACSTSARRGSATMVTGNFGPEIEKTLADARDRPDPGRAVHGLPAQPHVPRDAPLPPDKVQPNWAVDPERLRVLHVASPAKPVGADGQPVPDLKLTAEDNVSYQAPSGMTMATTRPLLKAAMKVLGDAYPGTVPFDLLRKQAREAILAAATRPSRSWWPRTPTCWRWGLLNCYMGSDLVELHGMPIAFGRQAGRSRWRCRWPGCRRPRAAGDQPPARGGPTERPGPAPGAAVGRDQRPGGAPRRPRRVGGERGDRGTARTRCCATPPRSVPCSTTCSTAR